MKHLKEGLIKQRGIVKLSELFSKKISPGWRRCDFKDWSGFDCRP